MAKYTRAAAFEDAVSNLLSVYKIPFIRIDYRCKKCGNILNKRNKGIPDFFCYNHNLAIECKTGSAKLTEEQSQIKLSMERSNIKYVVLRDTVDELLGLLEQMMSKRHS